MTNNNKVYYGEYTLKHWIDLILTGNIILPKYQRFFVWDKEQSKTLVEALIDNQFVPPVTIGSYFEDGKKRNLILDGQQRLTSILLAYLNLFPQKGKVKASNMYYANENDDQNDDETDFMDWDFNKLLAIINNEKLRDRSDIYAVATNRGYESLDFTVDLNKLEKCYLGFSFIVPATEDSKEQQKFYSKVFRSINIEGKKLLPLESREALYYLNNDLVGLFSPDFSKRITINDGKMDFVRYLSMISQYFRSGIDKIARGYSKNMEMYYENFIYAVVDDTQTKEFIRLSDKISGLNYKAQMQMLDKEVSDLKIIKNFDSIIDLDIYMFGLVYHTLFEGKTISEDKYEDLDKEIKECIADIKSITLHVKNPSALKHLKDRIDKSIKIYGEFVS